jgi:hypothetical protein
MEFIADPGILDVIRFLELVDKALADIAEGSDVIGKDSNVDAHLIPSNSQYYIILWFLFCYFFPCLWKASANGL